MLNTDKKESMWIFELPEKFITSQGFCKVQEKKNTYTHAHDIIEKNKESWIEQLHKYIKMEKSSQEIYKSARPPDPTHNM